MSDDLYDPRWRIRIPRGNSPSLYVRLKGGNWSVSFDHQSATTWPTEAQTTAVIRSAPPLIRFEGIPEPVG